ncbi:FAD-dependent oxidoreductase [Actinomadura livida]|uniref:FAD-dependent oxidoreductase n=1 Tax=Actinomadura livida TaxID=79909 RepID=A0A7W7MZI1_9ACTN|nr:MULTISPECIES: FAD-dependent oxidoreductase [Actinomadura]MBB4775927.1 succinate dehydrogenase/fumarate reductase flavoprotein subunit [Actinomadura catellatispora]GGU16708.1 FAD-binding protein [Actinomadura livida]
MSDEVFDLVVLGTGAAGLAAAVTAHGLGAATALVEKEPTVGGTTAVSGGVSWIPAHRRGPDPGAFPVEDALAYLGAFPDSRLPWDLVETFVRSGEAVLDLLEGASDVTFSISEGYPDYKPGKPGGRPDGGRSFNPSPFDFDRLGEWAGRVTRFPADWSDVGFDAETLARLAGTADAGARPGDLRFMGQALVAGLLAPLLRDGVPVLTGTRAERLIVEDGRVTGVAARTAAGTREFRARRGVVLATGGFEWDAGLVRAFLRGPMEAPVSPPGKTGDGLRMAMRAGADLANMPEAWWSTTVRLPGDEIGGHPRSRSIRSERTRPRSIMVNRAGRRFVNEAQDYNAIGSAFHQMDPENLRYPNGEAWLIFDERHLRTYGFLGVKPDEPAPPWFNGSAGPEELARRTGIDPAGLAETLRRWNRNVGEHGADPDFNRGADAYDQFWGDADLPPGPGRTLGAIDEPPYYAVPIFVGTIGTKGGPRTDVNGRVFDLDGGLIPGLYAAGNVSASPLGGAYPGAGATIGPALVFGARAAHHAVAGTPLKPSFPTSQP